ncbi:MAG: IS630 family transposase [Chloroflexota bacterium]|nr:IS630 family transposase [Chloroflexota bacterium]
MAPTLPSQHSTAKERQALEHCQRAGTTEYRLVRRAGIILALADGTSARALAAVLGVSRNTVHKWGHRWNQRFDQQVLTDEAALDQGCAPDLLRSLRDRPRSGRPPRFTLQARTQLVGLACRAPRDEGCADRDGWTLDLLVETALREDIVTSIHRSTIGRLLRQGEIKPHRWRMWLHSKDPAFKQKLAAIVPLYLYHHAGEVVLCIDEKTAIQALERAAPERLPGPHNVLGRREFEYIRHGTLTLFAAREVHSGQVTGWCTPQRRRTEFLAFLDRLADRYPCGRVHCVLDNLNTHSGADVAAWRTRHRRFAFHFTPFHASWANQVEVWFSILSRQLLRHASFSSLQDLEQRIMAFIERYNSRASPFKWTWKGYPLAA